MHHRSKQNNFSAYANYLSDQIAHGYASQTSATNFENGGISDSTFITIQNQLSKASPRVIYPPILQKPGIDEDQPVLSIGSIQQIQRTSS